MGSIALISDIHFGKFSRSLEFSVPGESIKDRNDGAVSIESSFKEILYKHKVEFVFVAGDLTSVGSPQEFYYCEKKIFDITREVGIPENNVIIGLGNHDIDWKITRIIDDYRKELYTEEDFSLIEEKYQLIGANSPLVSMNIVKKMDRNGPAPFSGVKEYEQFIVFVLNSGWKCAHNQEIPHGKLDIVQLQWITNELERYKNDNRWKIIMTHHHPFNYQYHFTGLDISLMEEGAELVHLAGKFGVDLVIHGHRHHPKAKTVKENGWDKVVTFICAGSFAVNSHERSNGDIPNTLHIIDLEDTPSSLELFNYQYSASRGWIPLQNNCPETPLDAVMKLGRVVDRQEIEKKFSSLAGKESIIKWNELDDTFKYIPIDSLNKWFKAYFSQSHNIIGKFPNDVCILAR